jgi:osmotically-inducible protein OsmY
MRLPALFVGVILLVSLITGCGKTVNETFDDATVTTRVKIMLISDPVIRADRIEVATFKGVVMLSGRVNTKQEEEKAIALARTVRGVKEVRSTLHIQP